MAEKNRQVEQVLKNVGPAVTFAIPGKMSDAVLVIPGRLPGLNEYTGANREYKYAGANMKKQYQAMVADCIRFTMRKVKFEAPVFLVYSFYERDKRRDHDNVTGFAHKVIQDALVQQHTIRDDGWDEITGHVDFFAVDAKNPRIEVRFIEQEREHRAAPSTAGGFADTEDVDEGNLLF